MAVFVILLSICIVFYSYTLGTCMTWALADDDCTPSKSTQNPNNNAVHLWYILFVIVKTPIF